MENHECPMDGGDEALEKVGLGKGCRKTKRRV